MEQKQFQCSGDCLKCHPNQRQYCACQHSYNCMRMVEELSNRVSVLEGKVDALKASDEGIVSMLAESEEKSEIPNNPIAQKGDGAEKIDAPKQLT